MAEPNIVGQCLAMLTEILNRQTQQPSLRNRIQKDLRYLPAFEGRPGTLPAFITSVDRIMGEYGNQAMDAYTVIYNEKILGPAKNYLETAPPETWEQCKEHLKLQYKPTKDQGHIMREISLLKVSSIEDLMNKITIFVSDIAECAIFSEHQDQIVNHLSSVLVLKIKEITAGALAAELYDKFSLQEIRLIINKFSGQDLYNLKMVGTNQVIRDKYPQRQFSLKPNQNPQQNYNNGNPFRNNNFHNNSNQFRNINNTSNQSRNNNFNQVRNNNFHNNSSQFRNNNFHNNSGVVRRNFNNNSADSRNLPQNNVPMEVDTINKSQSDEREFFTN